jgi:uncharacterized protein (TIRG00374 family)
LGDKLPAAAQKRRPLLIAVKLAAAAVILFLLYRLDLIRFQDLGAALENPWPLAGAAMCILISLPLLCLRWFVLLRGLGVNITFASALYIWCLSFFSNFFLPGGAGGDAVRLACLAVWAKGQRAPAMLTVVVDRYLSLISLFTIALVFIPWRYEQIMGSPVLQALSLTALALFAGGAALLILALFCSRALNRFLLKRKWQEKNLFKRTLVRLWEAVVVYRDRPGPLLACWGISIVSQIFTVTSVILVGRAMGNQVLQVQDYAFIVSFAALANVLPITPGGLGVGEAAFAQLSLLVHPAHSSQGYASIFLGFRAVSFLVSILSTLTYIVIGKPKSTAAVNLQERGENQSPPGDTG